jgi:proteasome activator subunit 4
MLASQYYMVTFLPISHPQSYLPMMFRLWDTVNSYAYDERMLQFLSRLAETHIDPNVSDPKRIGKIPDDARSEDEERPNWDKSDLEEGESWAGIYKDVGIFSDGEWSHLMCKTLASMGTPCGRDCRPLLN